jgi:hypothetical protein
VEGREPQQYCRQLWGTCYSNEMSQSPTIPVIPHGAKGIPSNNIYVVDTNTYSGSVQGPRTCPSWRPVMISGVASKKVAAKTSSTASPAMVQNSDLETTAPYPGNSCQHELTPLPITLGCQHFLAEIDGWPQETQSKRFEAFSALRFSERYMSSRRILFLSSSKPQERCIP